MISPKDDAASLSGAYALDALDEVDRKRFEAQLADSQETRNELTELADTAVLLGLAVDPVDPPAALKTSIMSAIASTPQLPRVETYETHVAAPGAAHSKAQARWFARPAAMLTAAAAAVVLIVGGGVVAGAISQNTQQQAQADQLVAINSADDSQHRASAVTGGGTATLVWSTDLKSSALIVEDFKALPADRVYELWYIDARGARSAGTFNVDGSGSTWRVLDGKMGFGDTVGVTIEPAGGSKAPTTTPIVAIASA